MKVSTLKRWAGPLTGVLSLMAVASSHAALIAPGGGPVALPGTANFGGTKVGDKTVGFAEPSNIFKGTLRTVVVQNGAGLLDYYFQLSNTTAAGPNLDIFRLAVTGFNTYGTGAGDQLDVNWVTNGLSGISGISSFVTGTEDLLSGDRLPTIASNQVGFDFSPFPGFGDPNNVDPGETSTFMVIRTNSRFFQNVNNEVVSGFGTAFASGFAPVAVPEPATLLAGLVLGSFVACRDLGRNRRRSPATKQS